MLKKRKYIHETIDISAKSGKDSTSTLRLVIHRVRFKKYLQKTSLAFKRGMKFRKPSILMVFEFHRLSFFLSATIAT
jgi:hypothetical protein